MVWYVSALVYGVGGLVVTGIALLVAFQEKLVYVPVLPGLTKSYAFTPARLRLNYEDVWLTSSDGVRLHAWFIKLFPHCQGPTILFFQENAGNIAHRLEMMRIMLQQLQCNVFMLSYRGYGASDGFPSQHGITKDAQAALDHLCQRSDIDTSRIVVFGRSLGGAVGAVLTKNNPDKVAALILENTFTSILDMAGVLLPFLKWFIGGSCTNGPKLLNFLVRSPWSTIDVVGQGCKMKWCPRHICRCFMPRHLLVIISVSLWNFLLACIWILGWLVVITTGEQFSSSLDSPLLNKRKTDHQKLKIILGRSD
ncbi:alpha/beta hydrolase domain-containing protein WAV2-like isoform X2 [Gastrolobium bilobum]|uniref:alpha/beta hydrolase domain-containing protein WAV2-like isoform X2 n=1 Tax=Gastrolobium bilobum TaxID=150636 RepID=UPI002AB1E5DC|nr:alpha/beta hydrolase domain-containing protein WAV2-like isoform X2 [Gastrolobium bilobum]